MRWFIDISSVGGSALDSQYCVEARQWQTALQQARKLRGDSGPLSAFSIELLDNGYRATDRKQKIRYLVKKAPGDTPLTVAEGSAPDNVNGQPAAQSLQTNPGSIAPARPRLESTRPTDGRGPVPALSKKALQGLEAVAAQPTKPVVISEPPKALSPSEAAVVPSPSKPELLDFELVEERSEEPTEESPITYREQAVCVRPGASREQVERLLLDRHRALLGTLAQRPAGKFIQLAVFDHKFTTKPERAPLGVLVHKDWRGDPVLSFPGFAGQTGSPGQAPGESVRPISVVPVGEPAEKPPESEAKALSLVKKAPERGGLKPPPEQRDLISELFEIMHQLHFMTDLAAGADFVAQVLRETFPSQVGMVQVFDINTSHFVVVRQWGAREDVLLTRTTDQDGFLKKLMRSSRAIRLHDVSADDTFLDGRWKGIVPPPRAVIACGVRQGGRYLGAVELANPTEAAEFRDSEANAIEYICEQFAEFLSNRPIVLEREIILKAR